jgi:2-methylisocitrate lyase-like PEP mutase family enzyme
MGQYGDQPDFGTTALTITPTGSPGVSAGQKLNSAALYIGTGGTLCATVVGSPDIGAASQNVTVFKNIPNGTFFPVIVDYVWIDDDNGVSTTCADIVALY